MNIDEFWKIIDKGKNSDKPEDVIYGELKKLSPGEITSYQEHFDTLHEKAYQWPLWGAAYVIEGGCSNDGFMDFRYGLISKGKRAYENALNNPDSLADLGAPVEIRNELFGYVAQEAYEEITDNQIPRKEFAGSREPNGKRWDFDDEAENLNQLPKLMKLHQ